MALAVYSAVIVQASDARYAMFLASLALSILCSEGWIGPVTCLVALILPPEIKSFGVSLWSAGANMLIMPAGNVIFSIYITSGGWVSGTPEWLPAARIFLAASIIGGYFVSAALFLTSAHFISQDQAKLETVLQTGTLDSVAPSRRRRLSMHIGVAAVLTVTIVLVVLSFMFSYDPKLVVKG
ncbi:hypothetical protein CVIRNUC_000957 [Coccomyxa viridis]|uniref:Uncharacterized protein n=1 Tax=Coccomyxa viridis TaxID=1274662 RepID=A0AAV1HU23_9CHLO|nr:hypothetical protein CVIRNUC_000957 [Coccomyxa viridis]